MDGWIKSYRSIMDNPIVCKDAEHFAVWGYLLHNAAYSLTTGLFNGKKIILQPGQLITGRIEIGRKFKINESKVQRILCSFESEQQIERQPGNRSTLITVRNWSEYQSGEQHNERQSNGNRTSTEQQLNDNCTTDEQQLNTYIRNKEIKKIRNKENKNSTHTVNSERKGVIGGNQSERALQLLDWLSSALPSVQSMPEPINQQQALWLVQTYSNEDIGRIFRDIDNKGATKNKSAYSTFTSYAGRDSILKERKLIEGRFFTYGEIVEMVNATNGIHNGKYKLADFTQVEHNGMKVWRLKTDLIREGKL